MSHRTDGPNGTRFFHNGDYSGNVTILSTPAYGKLTVEVPFEDIRELVLRYLADKQIESLENSSGDDLEKLLLAQT